MAGTDSEINQEGEEHLAANNPRAWLSLSPPFDHLGIYVRKPFRNGEIMPLNEICLGKLDSRSTQNRQAYAAELLKYALILDPNVLRNSSLTDNYGDNSDGT